MSDDETSLKTKNLDAILKAMKSKQITAKIGILGNKDARNNTGNNSASNATIGAAHEFGTSKLPQRSFLRMPISNELGKELENSKAFDEDSLKEIVKKGNFENWVEKVAILGVSIVLKAFDSNGFGTWAPLKPETLEHKKVKQTLVETHQLRDSIDYEINKS